MDTATGGRSYKSSLPKVYLVLDSRCMESTWMEDIYWCKVVSRLWF